MFQLNFFGKKQYSKVREEVQSRGIKRTILLPSIPANGRLQFNKDNPKLKGISKYGYGAWNMFNFMNTDVVAFKIELDFAETKTYFIPTNSSISVDEITYNEFNIYNLDTAAASNNEKAYIVVAYEPPLLRERRKKKLLGGILI